MPSAQGKSKDSGLAIRTYSPLLIVLVLGGLSWYHSKSINHVPFNYQLYFMILGFWPNFLASIFAAIIFFLIIDWRIRQRDEVSRDLQELKESERRFLDRNNNIHAALLQQFPPMIQRMTDIQNSAFRGGLKKYEQHTNPQYIIMSIAYDLRHYANVHMDTLISLGNLEVDIKQANSFALFSNYISILLMHIVRDKKDPEPVLKFLNRFIRRMNIIVRPGLFSRPHMERILLHFKYIENHATLFTSFTDIQKIEFCSILSEIVGHCANLFIEEINKCFKVEVAHLGHAKCHSDNP